MQDITKQLSMADTSGSTSQELYACSSCSQEIPAHLARVTCHSCTDHHLCANCQVIKAFYPPHTKSHSAMVFRESGVVVPLPPGFKKKSPPALPPRPESTFDVPKTQEQNKERALGAADWGAWWSIMTTPLEKRTKKYRGKSIDDTGILEVFEVRDVTGGGIDGPVASGGAGLPPSPPKSVKTGIERADSIAANVPLYPQPEKWEALFEKDSTPTPIFVALMSTIFSDLDTEHTGLLSPETYSNFLDAQGSDNNIWKRALDRAEGEHHKEVADLELSINFTDLSISHTLKFRPREAESSDEDPHSAAEGKIRSSIRFNPNMPMLSRQGFIDVCAIEYLKEPNKGHEYLRKVVKAFGIWEELGDLPREVLPERSIPNPVEIDTKALDVKVSDHESQGKEEQLTETSTTKSSEVIAQKSGDHGSIPSNLEERKLSIDTSAPIEIRRLISPIALGSPAMPFEVKGGESKINAIAKGEEFKPSRDEGTSQYREDVDYESSTAEEKPETKKREAEEEMEAEKKEVEEGEEVETKEEEKKGEEKEHTETVVAEKKIVETGSKKSSVEDLYSPN
ncbi:hypothetical protein VTL71DRAFT_13982 [Oculimacula yallundae]|uniref:DUF7514 domain-containing protein n=1 Tax=Oculimacula yallundae TaxID=86028 RepID=A0ABR4CNJ0_9HELO